MLITDLQRESHTTALEKGWWDRDREWPEMIALMHSELSEALEEWRGAYPFIYHVEDGNGELKPEGLAIELADLLIRVADAAEATGIDLTEALRQKLAYNKTRPHRHGGKLA